MYVGEGLMLGLGCIGYGPIKVQMIDGLGIVMLDCEILQNKG